MSDLYEDMQILLCQKMQPEGDFCSTVLHYLSNRALMVMHAEINMNQIMHTLQ